MRSSRLTRTRACGAGSPDRAGRRDAGAEPSFAGLARPWGVLWWLIFLAGFALSVLMAFRSQVGGDQQAMLHLGWQLAIGDWLPYGMPTSAGGRSPGGGMGLLVGAPLSLWADYRAPAIVTILLHSGAFFLLVRTVEPALTRAGRWLLLPFVWLNPWRVYFSAHLWNANFMFPIGVIHFVTAWSMRSRPVAWATFVHVVIVGLAAQVHSSFAILAILTVILAATRMIRIHWAAFALGVAVSLLALLPWALAVAQDSDLLPAGRGFPFRGILFVFPVLRGLLAWCRYGSLSMPGRLVDFDFEDPFGAWGGAVVGPVAWAFALLAHATFVVPLWANMLFVRRIHRRRPWRLPPTERRREWIWRFVVATLGAAVFAFSISPTTVMFWQGFVILQAPLLVVVFFLEDLLRTRHRAKTIRVLEAWSVSLFVLLLALAFAAPMYRCGGLNHPITPTPLAAALGVPLHCGPE